MISESDIERFIADDTTPRIAERPDWLDDVFSGAMLDPDDAVPSWVALWAAGLVAAACFGALAGLVVWAVIR